VEQLRTVAQQALDQCLTTKAKLKGQVDECHTRRDAARQKLQECLNRKKELKVKIDACHAKRDEARRKLVECVEAKSKLHEKLAKAKGDLAKSSLMEVASEDENEESIEVDAIAQLQEVLTALHQANANFDESGREYLEIDDLIKAALQEIEAANQEQEQIGESLREAAALERTNMAEVKKLHRQLQGALMALKNIDAESAAAEAESESAGQTADQVASQLSILLQTL